MLREDVMLRMFIRESLMAIDEDGWDDPRVVIAKKSTAIESDDDDDDIADDTRGSRYRISKSAHQQDTYANANKSLFSMKPVAPSNPGGPQSGRQPGGQAVSPYGRTYNAGY